MSSEEAVVRVESVWKSYQLREGLLGWSRRLLKREVAERHWALRDASFELRQGESLGIVGRNGAGKSTLLKVLAGVTFPTHGRVATRGRVFPMIELSAGLNRELTGRENVHVLGAIMGFGRREVESRMGAIEDFCELGEFFDVPIRKYSSGMLSRLGFAVAVNVEPDVLLVDEVLAVGDPAFQQKCYARILEMLDGGVTLVLVSHAFRQVGRLCERVVWLSDGGIVRHGPAGEVLLDYMNTLQKSVRGSAGPRGAGGGEREPAQIHRVRLEPETGDAARTDEAATLEIDYELETAVDDAFFVVQIMSQDNLPVLSFSSREAEPYRLSAGPGTIRCRIPRLQLLPGVYLLNAQVGRRGSGHKLTKGYRQDAVTVEGADFHVFESRSGYFSLDVDWRPADEAGVERSRGRT